MTNDELKRRAERAHFERFCDAARLPLIPESIEQPEPPAPDLVAKFESIGPVSFELVRLDDADRLTRLHLMQQMPNFLERAFEALPVKQKEALRAQYADAHITLDFRGAATLADRRRALPFLWNTLGAQPSGFRGEVDLWDLRPPRAISMIHVSRVKTGGRPWFRSLTCGYTLPLAADRIGQKLQMRYECDTPLELLAYVEYGEMAHANAADEIAEVTLPSLPSSQFRRVWVYEGLHRRVGLTLP
jgi:hypothetical protein